MTRRRAGGAARRPAGRVGPAAGRAALVGMLPAVVVALAAAAPALPAAADSFTPVRLSISIASVARRHVRLPVRVAVSADPGALDGTDGPVRIEVRLAGVCGATFQTTPGPVLLNRQLRPQPATGRAYTAAARGSGRPAAFGTETVCAFLEDTGSQRVYADDTSLQVDVSRPCTTAAARYDRARAVLRHAQRRLARTHDAAGRRRLRASITRARRTVRADRRRALRACGRGVAL